MKKNDILIGAAFAALLLAPVPALADAHGEIVTAMTHADLASKAGDAAGTKMHLQHALNCLVGPAGQGFDAKALNPCANAGAGAIPDSADPGAKARLQTVATKIAMGMTSTDDKALKSTATSAASELKVIAGP
ncbi:MAG: hypothetical protein JO167_13995 [Alphaproteobacteria bacterium]|nr:hypothetical protein [Alphaproteobacteria bacterium]